MPRALVFRGGWDGHDPVATTDLLVPKLRARGLDAETIESLEPLADASYLRSFDVIVPMWTMGKLPEGAGAALSEAVRSGVGMGGWHGGMGDAFREDGEYQFIVGGQFTCHPGDHIDYTVRITDTAHPITAGLPGTFGVHSEQYYMHVDPSNNVLAETEIVGPGAEWVKGVRMPVVWTRRHGQGLVAYSALGHNIDDFAAEPCLTIAERCVLFAAGIIR